MRAGYDLITRRYKRKMEQGSIAQKRGSIVLPWLYIYVYTYVQLSGRQRFTVDRNRAAIKSYLSYCYLGRNSPQVGIQGRTRENGTVSKARSKPRRQEPMFYLSLSLSLPCLYVHSVARSVHTVTGYILMVLDLCACTLSFLFLARNKRANNERNRTSQLLSKNRALRSLNFSQCSLSGFLPPGFLVSPRENGSEGTADRATPP